VRSLHLHQRKDGSWWIISELEDVSSMGPYDTRREAREDMLRVKRTLKYQSCPDYITKDKKKNVHKTLS